jgi:hypothetical protein
LFVTNALKKSLLSKIVGCDQLPHIGSGCLSISECI